MVETYEVKAEGNTVRICPTNSVNRHCPDEGGMLRKNRNTHEVVKLADFCQSDEYGTPCYVDECVPPGRWTYGFAAPYTCCSTCCGITFSSGVEVTEELAEDCERSEGNDGPVLFEGRDPLEDWWQYCYNDIYDRYPPDGDDGERGAGKELTGNGTDDSSVSDDDGGCSVSVGPRRAVLAVNALVLALGLGLVGRRRNRGS